MHEKGSLGQYEALDFIFGSSTVIYIHILSSFEYWTLRDEDKPIAVIFGAFV